MIDWTSEPLNVPITRVAALWGRSERAIQRLVKMRRFPAPALTHPMVWSRIDLEEFWRKGMPGPRQIRRAS